MKENYDLCTDELREAFFAVIEATLDFEDLSLNSEHHELFNWEISYYRTLQFLKVNKLVKFAKNDTWEITEKGNAFLDDGELDESNYEEENKVYEILPLNDIRSEIDNEVITAYSRYLIASMFSNGKIKEEDFNVKTLNIIKELVSIDGIKIEKWEEIRTDTFYRVKCYFKENEEIIFVNIMDNDIRVLECYDESNFKTLFAFIPDVSESLD